MNNTIEFKIDNTEYRVSSIQEIGDDLKNLKRSLIENNKEPRIYRAGKILKSGKTSTRQGGMFYRCTSGAMIKMA